MLVALVACLVLAGLIAVARPTPAAAATLPSGFSEVLVARGIPAPMDMAFAPDGRLFVTSQDGRIWIVKNGQRLATPFATLPVSYGGTQGLAGLAVDPAFATNGYLYVYYTASTPTIHNRISRLTAAGDTMVPGSEKVLLDLPTLTDSAINHDGGALTFGKDGKLYISVGDNLVQSTPQDLNSLFGKILRINPDGTIPTDNPYYGQLSGSLRSIWARGARNPFKMTTQPGTGRIFFNDVGRDTWEEVNDVAKGANYGWPLSEGPTTAPGQTTPIFSYNHRTGFPVGNVVTGGAFYNPPAPQFPTSYVGDYFVSDLGAEWIGVLDTSSGANTFSMFATGAAAVDLETGSDGALYYLTRSGGNLYKIVYRNSGLPVITQQPIDVTVTPGQTATFRVTATGATGYQWLRNGTDIPGATSATYTTPPTTLDDSGDLFRVRVSNTAGSVLSSEALLTVATASLPPVPKILTPAPGTTYKGGSIIRFSGEATDPEDGALPASKLTWRVDFHHDAHLHPFLPDTSGIASGEFEVPIQEETDPDVWYRIHLMATDSGGQKASTYVDVLPVKTTISLATSPPALQVLVDGQPTATPTSFQAVVGLERTLEAPAEQISGGRRWLFDRWSDGGARARVFRVPDAGLNLTAIYRDGGGVATRVTKGLVALYPFDEGKGTKAFDKSGAGTALDLTVTNATKATWVTGGVRLDGTAFKSVAASKVVSAAKQTNAYTLEAWVTPLQALPTATGSILNLGASSTAYGANLQHTRLASSSRFDTRAVTSAGTFRAGTLPPADTSLVHLAATLNPATQKLTIYRNGKVVASVTAGGTLTNWSTTWPFSVGADPASAQPFRGTVWLAAVYGRALTGAEVTQNYTAGPGGQPNGTAPTIVQQPADQTVAPGARATFTVKATGTEPLSYQWYHHTDPIPGATSASYTTPPVTSADDGHEFTVKVSNAFGSATSTPAMLRVRAGSRVTNGLLALYELKEGTGTKAKDTSGVGTALDLTVVDASKATWVPGGVRLSGTSFRSTVAASKVVNAAKASGGYTLEAWVTPSVALPAVTGWIAGVGDSGSVFGAALRHEKLTTSARFESRSVTSTATYVAYGKPPAGTALTHVVVARDAASKKLTLYVNGVKVSEVLTAGTLSWSSAFKLALGGTPTGGAGLQGTLWLAAVYGRGLTAAEVAQNHAAGPG